MYSIMFAWIPCPCHVRSLYYCFKMFTYILDQFEIFAKEVFLFNMIVFRSSKDFWQLVSQGFTILTSLVPKSILLLAIITSGMDRGRVRPTTTTRNMAAILQLLPSHRPLHKWRLNLNNNTLHILSLTFMFQDKGIFT